MSRVYFDSNVFSNLKKNEEEKYQNLNKNIQAYKNSVSFFFSHAHILDKKKDKTDLKFEDFEFMETIVGDNYLSYHGNEKITSFYLATPNQVFDDELPDQDLTNLFGFLNINTSDNIGIGITKEALKPLFEQEIYSFNQEEMSEISGNAKSLISKIIPQNKQSITLGDMFESLGNFYQELFTKGEAYKDLRGTIENEGKSQPLTFNGTEYNISELYIDNRIQDKFVNFVKDTMSEKDKSKIYYYEFYIQSYSLLDMLGYSKDKVTKKNTFNNLINDSLHSYYARYCDYLVTDDVGLITKSSILYKLYDVSTQILSVDEFNEIINSVGKRTENTLPEFYKKLSRDLSELPIVRKVEADSGTMYNFLSKEKYFNFFDKILVLKTIDKGIYVFLTKNLIHHLAGPNFRECEQITNLSLEVFGMDLGEIGPFNFEKESKEINENEWKGRRWEFGDASINLYNNEDIKELCMQIGPFFIWSPIFRFYEKKDNNVAVDSNTTQL